MFSSIRWTLMAWQALILSIVIVCLGSTLYYRLRHATFAEIDAELLGVSQVLATALRGGADGPPLEIPESYRRRFGRGEKDAPYFVVWQGGGQVVKASNPAMDIPFPEPRPPREKPTNPWYTRDREQYRELVLAASGDAQVLVGRSVLKEQTSLQRMLSLLISAGGAALAIGLVGNWLLTSRALRPIARMSAVAESISASNLSQRIDAAGTKSELGGLAAVLNSTFQRLEAAFQRQARFTADASHELRTPLAVIQSQTELALARERTGEEYRWALEACHRASQRLRTLTDDLLTLARADAGQLVSAQRPLDLQATVAECAEMIQPLADERQVHVNLDLQSAAVTGDAERLKQLVTNLLSNAVRYNREGGTVDVKLGRDGTNTLLTVADTGIGIPPEDQRRIFERFARLDHARSRDQGGNGLGLAICKEVAEAHGGRIELTSNAGQGTTVSVRLPSTPAD
jgi:two-component system OmpR family sensor kinase